jgi:hypothetical protein
MTDNNLVSIAAQFEAEKVWHQKVWESNKAGPWMKAKGSYNDGNIPGKSIQPLNYAEGVGTYVKHCEEVARKGYEGFTFVTKAADGADR